MTLCENRHVVSNATGRQVAPNGRCVACGRTEVQPLYTVRGFDVVACPCGLGRTVLPPGFDPATIYDADYYEGGHEDGYPDYGGNSDELRREFRRVVAELRKHVSGGKLIEYGCAYGYFLEEASQHFSTLGVELSDHARQISTDRGLDVVREADEELLAARGPFDAAVMLDVLEHMQDPSIVLGHLQRAMRPGATLMITTGDFGSVLARLMGKRWRLMTPPQHLWFFTRSTITALLAAHGFRVTQFTHPWKQVPFELIAYQAGRYLGGQKLVSRFVPHGTLPINLFDAMRVVAVRG